MANIAFSSFSFDNVHENLALEEVLLREVSNGHLPALCRFWRNPESVIMGISRSIKADLNIENIMDDNIPLARRASGGGTVYHDENTLSFSFFFPWSLLGYDDDPRKVDDSTINPFLDIIIAALKEFGLNAYRQGISDIFIDGKKISGNAQKRIRGAILHHGTILEKVNLAKMNRYQKNPPERLEISHDDFVTSLAEFKLNVTSADIKNAVAKVLSHNDHTVIDLDLASEHADLLDASRKLTKEIYETNEWIFRRE